MLVLGINAFHGDAAASLVDDGKIVAAVAEERFTRNKHEGGLPIQAIAWCLGQTKKRVEHVAISRNPSLFRLRKIITIFENPLLLKRINNRLNNANKINAVKEQVQRIIDHKIILHQVEHHRAHLAYTFAVSNFDECNLLSVDGFGDFVSTAWGSCDGKNVKIDKRVFFPHSIGIFYTALTQFLGFSGYGEEYKVMALASFGTPRYLELFNKIISKTCSGFQLSTKYFTHTKGGADMTYGAGTPVVGKLYSKELEKILGPARRRDQLITERHYDIAATLQAMTTDMVLHLAMLVKKTSNLKNLAISGGVAQNSVTNGVFERSGLFENYWFPSAPADDGTAIGAAAIVALANGDRFVGKGNNSAFLGSNYCNDNSGLISAVVDLLGRGKIVGWFEGRAEFGPRALGHRSILADPRLKDIKEKINAVIKKRENFRPFAPMVLLEDCPKYFEMTKPSPNMMTVALVKKEWRDRLSAVTHFDGTARVQTVTGEFLPNIATLLERWRDVAGMSVLLNTSFNENEPIVNTPEEAKACFQRTKMDALAINGELFVK
ncbi:MAG: carbamoyltransferase C-terminal domain-containing protein [bacterium]|nr:carbamoyltransferase C-terminal domain-containing protein [bacterium]